MHTYFRVLIIAVIVAHWIYTFPLRIDTLKPAYGIISNQIVSKNVNTKCVILFLRIFMLS
ncbi:hypothetical protein JCM10914A_28550 [Paenibacillus sp. JCM 10914]